MPCAAYGRSLPSDRLDARDHLVDRLVHRYLFTDDAVHRLRPDVLVVDDRELVVPGELEGHRAGVELVVHRFAMTIGLPDRPLGRRLAYRLPAANTALDVRRKFLV